MAMSGGVDSSVAAALLKEKGYDILGIFLHFWKEESAGAEALNKCCSIEALQDARRVAERLGIRLYTLNFSRLFKKEVVDYFLESYENGKTPNPCVVCNKKVKLGHLLKKGRELGYDYVATGHYARNEMKTAGGKHRLCRPRDREKDQSYFLYSLSQEELSRLFFPLAGYSKDEVRAMAKKLGLPVAEKGDSQEVCFVPEKGHNEFLKRHLKLKPGKIVCDGRTVGEHGGLPLYTIGQRKGVEIGGTGPYYVSGFDKKKNILLVVRQTDDQKLFGQTLFAGRVSWLSGQAPAMPLACEAVIRYRHRPQPCLVETAGKNAVKVTFAKPERAITAGQSVVFYQGDEVLGGGVISSLE